MPKGSTRAMLSSVLSFIRQGSAHHSANESQYRGNESLILVNATNQITIQLMSIEIMILPISST
jgi:hypothetical protein